MSATNTPLGRGYFDLEPSEKSRYPAGSNFYIRRFRAYPRHSRIRGPRSDGRSPAEPRGPRFGAVGFSTGAGIPCPSHTESCPNSAPGTIRTLTSTCAHGQRRVSGRNPLESRGGDRDLAGFASAEPSAPARRRRGALLAVRCCTEQEADRDEEAHHGCEHEKQEPKRWVFEVDAPHQRDVATLSAGCRGEMQPPGGQSRGLLIRGGTTGKGGFSVVPHRVGRRGPCRSATAR